MAVIVTHRHIPISRAQQTRYLDPVLFYCLRRWPNIKPTLVQRLVFAEICRPMVDIDNIVYMTYRVDALNKTGSVYHVINWMLWCVTL